MTRLMVLTPGFHGYGSSIGRSFERIGYDVTVYVYDAVTSRTRKAWNKARYELPAQLRDDDRVQSSERMTRLAIEAVRESRPDRLLVIRGDRFGLDFWPCAAHRGRPIIVWLYDELRRTPRFDEKAVAPYARFASYSPGDARDLTSRGIETRYLPTGFDDERLVAEHSPGHGLVSFVGSPLPGRVDALQTLHEHGVPVRAWGRGWSDHPVDRARTWRTGSRGIPNGRDVPGDLALAIMRDCAASLNVHGDQDGFTMRTFEIPGSGGVQLVDRDEVSEFYEPGSEVLVFHDDDELVDLAQHTVQRPQDFSLLRQRARRRTLAEHTFVHRARALDRLW